MNASQTPIPDFEMEMSTTRRLLERVPSDKGEWKPHPKSFPLGHLAQLVAWIPGWVANTASQPELDLTKAPGYTFEKTEALVAMFDQNVRDAMKAIESMTPADLDATWNLTRSGQVLWSAPRRVVLRNHVNHLSHHRGQLTVYLRLLDVPLPPIYGPTADERM